MCHKCLEYDEKIARYRRLAREVADDRFARTAETMVGEMLAQRAALHAEQPGKDQQIPGSTPRSLTR